MEHRMIRLLESAKAILWSTKKVAEAVTKPTPTAWDDDREPEVDPIPSGAIATARILGDHHQKLLEGLDQNPQ